jgi:multidrug resistance efflux pump
MNGSKRILTWLLVAGIGLVGGTAAAAGSASDTAPAAAAPATDDNPYILLYKLRVDEAESNLHRAEALSELANSKLDRGRRLIYSSAMAQEEYDTLVSDAAVAVADVDLGRKKVDEAKAYLKIVEALVKRGVSIPLCTYEMQ